MTMIRKIKQMLAGRFIVLFVFSCFFAVIGFGQMGLFKTGELPYPSQSGLDVSKVSTSSEQFFDSLEQFANENHLIIYRSVVENSDLKGFVFGNSPKKSDLTKNPNLLKQLSPVGIYYVDGNLSKAKQKQLASLKANMTVHPTGWEGIAGELLYGSSIRTKTLWMSLMLFSVSLLALKMAKIRQVMVGRTLGKIRLQLGKEGLSVILGLLVTGIVLSMTNHYFGTMLVISLALILAVIGVLLGLIILVINLIFFSYVCLIPMLVILKHKETGRFFSYMWLLAIILSMSLMTTAVTVYQKGYQASKYRQVSVKKWQSVSKFAQLSYTIPAFMNDMPKTKEERAIYDEKIDTYNKKWRLFDRQFSEYEKLFINVPQDMSFLNELDAGETIGALDFNQPTKTIQIKKEWVTKTWQVSPSLVKLSQTLFEGNASIYRNRKPVTVYVPKKYQAYQADILPVVTSKLINSGLKPTDFDVIIIPDDFKLFVSDVTQLRDSDQPLTRVTGQIIAQYDYDQMPDSAAINRDVSATILDTLYLAEKLPKAIKVAELSRDVVNISDTYQNLVNYQEQAEGDMVRSALVMVGLFVMQIFVIYEFLKLRLSLVVKKLCLLTLLGKITAGLIIKTSLPLVIGIGLAMGVAFYKGASIGLVFGSLGVYIGLTLLLVFVVQEVMQHKRVTILKGESDLM